jgi:hypothetical protein
MVGWIVNQTDRMLLHPDPSVTVNGEQASYQPPQRGAELGPVDSLLQQMPTRIADLLGTRRASQAEGVAVAVSGRTLRIGIG